MTDPRTTDPDSTDPHTGRPRTDFPPPRDARVDFGAGALVAAVAVLVLLLAAVLPWTGLGASGWEVVLGRPGVTVLPRLFGTLAVVFGVVGTAATLLTARWPLVFVTAAGCAITSVTGLWAIWSQNTSAGTGPGGGLWLALLAMIVLAGRWAGYAFSRR
ncbi:Rv2732c family membrane protein [Actinomycetospora sp. NBC_00405]|uniref:Rv2732c family membrane protein n=1 Tax=Actinomycetospora sp. NBC_00405 TaxID=2975952 RepID=UPI002E225EEB